MPAARWSSHEDTRARRCASSPERHVPASLTKLEQAVRRAHAAYEKAERDARDAPRGDRRGTYGPMRLVLLSSGDLSTLATVPAGPDEAGGPRPEFDELRDNLHALLVGVNEALRSNPITAVPADAQERPRHGSEVYASAMVAPSGFGRARDAVLTRLAELKFGDVSASCGLGWQPSVFAPVFYGIQDFDISPPGDGSTPHVRARVFYPSTDGSPDNAPLLGGCGRYPADRLRARPLRQPRRSRSLPRLV
jgi:hypothetical protein